jgi:hypothetical protein
LHFLNQNNKMDDMKYFGRAMKPLRTPFTVDKEIVLKVTSQLLNREIAHESLNEAFGLYVEACMEYAVRKDAPPRCTSAPTPYDDLLLPPKKISTFVKKNINPFHYAKNSEGKVLAALPQSPDLLRPKSDPVPSERMEPPSPERPRSSNKAPRLPSKKNDAVPQPRRAVLVGQTIEFRGD